MLRVTANKLRDKAGQRVCFFYLNAADVGVVVLAREHRERQQKDTRLEMLGFVSNAHRQHILPQFINLMSVMLPACERFCFIRSMLSIIM